MASSLPPLSTPDGLDGPPIYYNNKFRNQIECYLPLLQSTVYSAIINVEPSTAFAYTGDFYGLLIQYGIPRQYHWVCLRINNMKSPREYDGKTLSIWVCDRNYVDNIANSINTSIRAVSQA